MIVLDAKEITIDERNRIETSQMYDQQKAPPMIHYSQYPTAKVPVKLNSVNFDGVFNNNSMQQNLNPQGPGGKPGQLGGVQGLSINGQGQGLGGQNDMQSLIQVQSMNQQM